MADINIKVSTLHAPSNANEVIISNYSRLINKACEGDCTALGNFCGRVQWMGPKGKALLYKVAQERVDCAAKDIMSGWTASNKELAELYFRRAAVHPIRRGESKNKFYSMRSWAYFSLYLKTDNDSQKRNAKKEINKLRRYHYSSVLAHYGFFYRDCSSLELGVRKGDAFSSLYLAQLKDGEDQQNEYAHAAALGSEEAELVCIGRIADKQQQLDSLKVFVAKTVHPAAIMKLIDLCFELNADVDSALHLCELYSYMGLGGGIGKLEGIIANGDLDEGLRQRAQAILDDMSQQDIDLFLCILKTRANNANLIQDEEVLIKEVRDILMQCMQCMQIYPMRFYSIQRIYSSLFDVLVSDSSTHSWVDSALTEAFEQGNVYAHLVKADWYRKCKGIDATLECYLDFIKNNTGGMSSISYVYGVIPEGEGKKAFLERLEQIGLEKLKVGDCDDLQSLAVFYESDLLERYKRQGQAKSEVRKKIVYLYEQIFRSITNRGADAEPIFPLRNIMGNDILQMVVGRLNITCGDDVMLLHCLACMLNIESMVRFDRDSAEFTQYSIQVGILFARIVLSPEGKYIFSSIKSLLEYKENNFIREGYVTYLERSFDGNRNVVGFYLLHYFTVQCFDESKAKLYFDAAIQYISESTDFISNEVDLFKNVCEVLKGKEMSDPKLYERTSMAREDFYACLKRIDAFAEVEVIEPSVLEVSKEEVVVEGEIAD